MCLLRGTDRRCDYILGNFLSRCLKPLQQIGVLQKQRGTEVRNTVEVGYDVTKGAECVSLSTGVVPTEVGNVVNSEEVIGSTTDCVTV